MTSATVWVLTLVGVGAMIVFDFAVVVRKPHSPTLLESVKLTVFYIAPAVVFGISMPRRRSASPPGTARTLVPRWSVLATAAPRGRPRAES